jgi:RNA polymerase sigma-70 factor (ECF subfamily)
MANRWIRRQRREDDDQRFERLYAEHAQALLGFLTLRTGNRVLAEDLLADTFERVLRKGRTFHRRRGSEKTWLYAIALNLLRDSARRRDAETRALERARPVQPEATDDTGAVEDRVDLDRALGALSQEERDAIALRFGADLKMAEIAKLIGQPESTVQGRIYRGLDKLRDRVPALIPS